MQTLVNKTKIIGSIKTILNTSLLTLLGLTLLTVPLRAEYSNNEAREHYENGLAYARKGYPDLAVKEIEEAVRLEPKVTEGRKYLAVAYSLRMNLKRAIKEYEALFLSNPEIVKVSALRTNWLKENEETLQDLEKELEQFRQTRPQNPMVHVLLGWLYGEAGRLKEAHRELLYALEKAPYLDRNNLGNENKAVASLMWELETAMQSSPSLVRTQLDLLLFALNR